MTGVAEEVIPLCHPSVLQLALLKRGLQSNSHSRNSANNLLMASVNQKEGRGVDSIIATSALPPIPEDANKGIRDNRADQIMEPVAAAQTTEGTQVKATLREAKLTKEEVKSRESGASGEPGDSEPNTMSAIEVTGAIGAKDIQSLGHRERNGKGNRGGERVRGERRKEAVMRSIIVIQQSPTEIYLYIHIYFFLLYNFYIYWRYR